MAKLKVNPVIVKRNAALCKKRGIIMPTFKQMKDPNLIPEKIKKALKPVGLWDINPINLFRITWKNDHKTGGFGAVNMLEIPREITGIDARVIGIVGKYFPTGAHKVGAAFGCLAPRMVTGEFDAQAQKAVWPSTGNYCRGGAFDSKLLGTTPVAILPEGMSKERFDWLKEIGSEVIATPGTESNVKEIYDKCWEIKKTRKDCVIFNQFEEMGNPMWHYHVTGSALEEAFNVIKGPKSRLAAFTSATGSAGTIGAGDYLKKKFPGMKITASEALQCPTILSNGFGEHRIEGIGDKHIPWVHNVRNTDVVTAIDDEACVRIARLFNEPEGKKVLAEYGVKKDVIEKLNLLGFSGISNLLSAIKTAKYYEMDKDDVVLTVFTDSMELYGSRIKEMEKEMGKYTRENALVDMERRLLGESVNYMKELTYTDRKAVHNLKYFTWIEQQGRTSDELRKLWSPAYWDETFGMVEEYDRLIEAFNKEVGLSEMATKGVFRVECPHCGESFDADFWTVVRGDRDADVRELILSGEFDILMCPKCEAMFQHEEPFLYIDPSRDILAFVLPETYLEKKDEWIARMKADYEPLRASLGHGLRGEPACLFGLEPLTRMLQTDRDREEETEVMEFMAREDGLNLLPVSPAAARELDILFSVPVPSGLKGRAAALKAAETLRARNDALPRLKKLIDTLSALKGDELPFVKN